jgi:hypothetical protein
MEERGRGAWTSLGKDNDRAYYTFVADAPLDGSTPDQSVWHDRVHRGVLGIQRLLRLNGTVKPQKINGVYDESTSDNIRIFQLAERLKAEGAVGPQTMQALLRPVILSAAVGAKVHPRWLFALAATESGFDPGAQGWDHPVDSGLWQFNTDYAEIDMAYNPAKAAAVAGRRLAAAMAQFSGKGRRLRNDCALGQHNNPAGAEAWFATGTPPAGGIEAYVDTVRDNARDWFVY